MVPALERDENQEPVGPSRRDRAPDLTESRALRLHEQGGALALAADAHIMVGVATYNRPAQLEACLSSLMGLDRRGARVTFVVVDNDPLASAMTMVASHPIEARFITEPRPGISAARNAVLSAAELWGCDAVAFLDDDETASKQWLAELIAVQQWSNADIVSGPAVPVLEVGTSRWLGQFFRTPDLPDGTRIAYAAANNMLMVARWYSGEAKLRFDEGFSASGGEDTDFTSRVSANGGVMVWGNDAIVYDHLPAARISWAWVCRRAIRNGSVSARLRVNAGLSLPMCAVMGLARVGGGILMCVGRLITFRLPRETDVWPLLRGIGWLAMAIGQEVRGYRSAERVDAGSLS